LGDLRRRGFMKRLVIAVILIGAAALAGVLKRGQAFERSPAIREQFTRNCQLSADAEVTIERIRGSVTVEAYDGSVAEISVTGSGKSPDEVENSLKIEASEHNITIRGNGIRPTLWRRIFGPAMRQDVRLRIPRQAALRIRNVNGLVVISDMDADLDVMRVNGRVEIRRSGGRLDINGVNGRLKLDLAKLQESGMRITGVNGRVVLQVSPDLNADLTGSGINGSVVTEIPGLEIHRTEARLRARLGTGGPIVSLSNINGKVQMIGLDNYDAEITTASD
jgi:hypothetical protein